LAAPDCWLSIRSHATGRGGEALYASGTRGAEILPDGLRRLVAGRSAVYNYAKVHAKLTGASENGVQLAPQVCAEQPDSRHQVLCPHPVTGRPSVYLTPEEMLYIEGYSPAESRAIALEIIDCITAPEIDYALHWRPRRSRAARQFREPAQHDGIYLPR
jgi:taurine dioxygenase